MNGFKYRDRCLNMRESSLRHRVEKINLSVPNSYTENNSKERECISYLRSFKEAHDLNAKVTLFARNEYGIDKCITSTLRPTLCLHPEIINLHQIQNFVSSYLVKEDLEEPCTFPSVLPSPSSVIHWRAGSSFDFSILLASLLLGANYDAYVVHGVAPRWLCKNDLRGCQYNPDPENKFIKIVSHKETYCPKDSLTCDDTKPRDHCWVLVRGGARNIEDMLFLEPMSGHTYSSSDAPFLHIYSVWNPQNIWINKNIDVSPEKMTFDFKNNDTWLSVFNDGAASCSILNIATNISCPPVSWVSTLDFPEKLPDIATEKFIAHYQDAKIEVFSDKPSNTLMLKSRATFYSDSEALIVNCIEEVFFYQPCQGSLLSRTRWPRGRQWHEMFDRGHQSAVSKWEEHLGESRTLTFYEGARLDCLVAFQEFFEKEVRYTFSGRSDNLRELYLKVALCDKNLGLYSLINVNDNKTISIISATEVFNRPEIIAKPVEVISKREFMIKEKYVSIEYFPCNDRSLPIVKKIHKRSKEQDSNYHSTITAEKDCMALIRELYVEIQEAKILHDKTVAPIYLFKELREESEGSNNVSDIQQDFENDWISKYLPEDMLLSMKASGDLNKVFDEGEANRLQKLCIHLLNERLNERKHKLTERIEKNTNKEANDPGSKVLRQRLALHESTKKSRIAALQDEIRKDHRFKVLFE